MSVPIEGSEGGTMNTREEPAVVLPGRSRRIA